MPSLPQLLIAAMVLTVVATGCAQPSPTTASDRESSGRSEAAAAQRKTLTIAQPRAREGFGPWFMRGSGRILQYEELHSNFLASTDAKGNLEARLASALPSVDAGSLVVLPDETMRTVWSLNKNARWHDGTPFTADDVVFGYQVATHPEIPVQQSPTLRAIARIDAQDASTLVITYRNTFFDALAVGFRDLYPLPKHLLGAAFEGDKDAFTKLPYFSTEYVHTGPYRVREFMPGESFTMDRFDDYFRGRPRVDAIIVRFIGDDNAQVTNMLANAVDIAGELPTDIAARLRDEWKQSRNGYVVSQQGNWRFVSVQFHPQFQAVPELARDVRIRRGLVLAINRDAIREAVVPGFENTSADTFMVAGDERNVTIGTPFARYQFDPARAVQELASAGWTRAADGRLLNSAGQQVQFELRTTGDYDPELSAVANDWRQLGIDVRQEVMTRALSQDREYIAKFPGLEITAQSNSEGIFRRFDPREQPLAENRWVGSNGGHYANDNLERQLRAFYSTVDTREQAVHLRDLAEIIATDLPALPMYFSVNALVALSHVRGLEDFPGATRVGTTARNAHLWERT